MSQKVAVPVKVEIPGRPDITRIATGYSGGGVAVDVNGQTVVVPKDSVSKEAHAHLNEELRKQRK